MKIIFSPNPRNMGQVLSCIIDGTCYRTEFSKQQEESSYDAQRSDLIKFVKKCKFNHSIRKLLRIPYGNFYKG